MEYAVKRIAVTDDSKPIVMDEINLHWQTANVTTRCLRLKEAYVKGPDFLVVTEFMAGGTLHDYLTKKKW